MRVRTFGTLSALGIQYGAAQIYALAEAMREGVLKPNEKLAEDIIEELWRLDTAWRRICGGVRAFACTVARDALDQAAAALASAPGFASTAASLVYRMWDAGRVDAAADILAKTSFSHSLFNAVFSELINLVDSRYGGATGSVEEMARLLDAYRRLERLLGEVRKRVASSEARSVVSQQEAVVRERERELASRIISAVTAKVDQVLHEAESVRSGIQQLLGVIESLAEPSFCGEASKR